MHSMGTRGQGRGRWAAVTLLVSCASLAQGPSVVVSPGEQAARDAMRQQILARELSDERAALAQAAAREIDRTRASDRIGAAEASAERERHAANLAALEREMGLSLRPAARTTGRSVPDRATTATSHLLPAAAESPAVAARTDVPHPVAEERPAPAARAEAPSRAEAPPAWDIYRHAPQATARPIGDRPAWDMFAAHAAPGAGVPATDGRAGEAMRPAAVFRAGVTHDDSPAARRGSP